MNDDNTPPSTDGFLRTTNQAAQPHHRSVQPALEQVRGVKSSDIPKASSIVHPNHTEATDPSAKKPFQPASFYNEPVKPTPKLPVIVDEPRPVVEPPEHSDGLRDLLSVLGVLASALLLAFALISFVFQSYQVDGQSMRTTLEHRDHLIIWKVPRTTAKLTGGHYLPHRGDIIVFDEPEDAEFGDLQPKRQLIKRVIGLPGERVVYNGTHITVYNKEHPKGFNPDANTEWQNKMIFEQPAYDDRTVGENEVYVSGDNRDNSKDSRWFGPIDTNLIVGKMVVRILPLNTFKLF